MYFATTQEYQSYYLVKNVEKYFPNSANVTTVSPVPTPLPMLPNANSTIWKPVFEDLAPVPANDTIGSLGQSFSNINGYEYQQCPTVSFSCF